MHQKQLIKVFFKAVKTKIDIFDIHTFRRQSKIHFERTFEKINKCIQVKDNVDFIYHFWQTKQNMHSGLTFLLKGGCTCSIYRLIEMWSWLVLLKTVYSRCICYALISVIWWLFDDIFEIRKHHVLDLT